MNANPEKNFHAASERPARAAAALGDAAQRAADKIASSADDVASGIASAQTRGSAAFERASHRIQQGVQSASKVAREQGDRAVENVRAYTTRNPLLAVCLAAGAGFILSRVFGSRR